MAVEPTLEEIKANPLIEVMRPVLVDGLLYGTVHKWCIGFKKVCTCGNKTGVIEHFDVSSCYLWKRDTLAVQEKCSCGLPYSDIELVQEIRKPFTFNGFEF